MTNELRSRGDSGRLGERGETAVAKYVDYDHLIHLLTHLILIMRRFSSLDIAPKKYQNAGLRKNAIFKKPSEPVDPFQSGGLNDEDAYAVRPTPRKDLERHHSRGRNVCLFSTASFIPSYITAYHSLLR